MKRSGLIASGIAVAGTCGLLEIDLGNGSQELSIYQWLIASSEAILVLRVIGVLIAAVALSFWLLVVDSDWVTIPAEVYGDRLLGSVDPL